MGSSAQSRVTGMIYKIPIKFLVWSFKYRRDVFDILLNLYNQTQELIFIFDCYFFLCFNK